MRLDSCSCIVTKGRQSGKKMGKVEDIRQALAS